MIENTGSGISHHTGDKYLLYACDMMLDCFYIATKFFRKFFVVMFYRQQTFIDNNWTKRQDELLHADLMVCVISFISHSMV